MQPAARPWRSNWSFPIPLVKMSKFLSSILSLSVGFEVYWRWGQWMTWRSERGSYESHSSWRGQNPSMLQSINVEFVRWYIYVLNVPPGKLMEFIGSSYRTVYTKKNNSRLAIPWGLYALSKYLSNFHFFPIIYHKLEQTYIRVNKRCRHFFLSFFVQKSIKIAFRSESITMVDICNENFNG